MQDFIPIAIRTGILAASLLFVVSPTWSQETAVTEPVLLLSDEPSAALSPLPDSAPANATSASEGSEATLANEPWQKLVSVRFVDKPFHEAIRELAIQHSVDFVVDGNVPNTPVSIEVEGISLQAAINLLISQVGQPGETVGVVGSDGTLTIRRNPKTLRTADEAASSLSGFTYGGVEPSNAQPDPGETPLTFFSLQHAEANSAALLLEQLMENRNLRIIPDVRTNSLYVRGDEAAVKEVEEFLKLVDQPARGEAGANIPPARPSGSRGRSEFGGFGGGMSPRSNSAAATSPLAAPRDPAASPQSVPVKPSTDDASIESVSSLKEQFQKLETNSRRIASQLLLSQQQRGADDSATRSLKSQLQQAVRASFNARQNLQRAEVQELQRQLVTIQQSLQTRDRIADLIVQRRVDELLNPAANWEPGGTAVTDSSSLQQQSETDSGEIVPMDMQPDTTFTTPLEGDWELLTVEGPGVQGWERGVTYRIRGNTCTIVRPNGWESKALVDIRGIDEGTIRLCVPVESRPVGSRNVVVDLGAYSVSGNELRIRWAGWERDEIPTMNDPSTGNLHTLRRIPSPAPYSPPSLPAKTPDAMPRGRRSFDISFEITGPSEERVQFIQGSGSIMTAPHTRSPIVRVPAGASVDLRMSHRTEDGNSRGIFINIRAEQIPARLETFLTQYPVSLVITEQSFNEDGTLMYAAVPHVLEAEQQAMVPLIRVPGGVIDWRAEVEKQATIVAIVRLSKKLVLENPGEDVLPSPLQPADDLLRPAPPTTGRTRPTINEPNEIPDTLPSVPSDPLNLPPANDLTPDLESRTPSRQPADPFSPVPEDAPVLPNRDVPPLTAPTNPVPAPNPFPDSESSIPLPETSAPFSADGITPSSPLPDVWFLRPDELLRDGLGVAVAASPAGDGSLAFGYAGSGEFFEMAESTGPVSWGLLAGVSSTEPVMIRDVDGGSPRTVDELLRVLAKRTELDGTVIHASVIEKGMPKDTDITIARSNRMIRTYNLQPLFDRLGVRGTQEVIAELDRSENVQCYWPNRGQELFIAMMKDDEKTKIGFLDTMASNGVRFTLANQIRPRVPDKIETGAWGQVINGLQLAVVSDSDNTPSDKLMTISYVVRNVSGAPIRISGEALQTAADSEVRLMNRSQVQTSRTTRDGFVETSNYLLDPGTQAVLAVEHITVTDDQDVPAVAGADLTIHQPGAFRNRNIVYLLRGHLQLSLYGEGEPQVPLTSGNIAIAFSNAQQVTDDGFSSVPSVLPLPGVTE
ncbi:MAG: hypothetical protein KDA96_03250 [Planctomycetaceae bacterium]|nr:hypothetical protein [Planctomycetaceae bacterium]